MDILKKKDDIKFPKWLIKDPNYIYTTNNKFFLIIPGLKN